MPESHFLSEIGPLRQLPPPAFPGPAGPAGALPERPGPERPAPYRLPWAELLRRVFLVDVLECPRCDARMRIVAAVTGPGAVERILHHLGESAHPPPVAGPRAPPHDDAEAEARQPDHLDVDPGDDASS